MSAAATPTPYDPALTDALAELTRHGLDVARFVANYANTENAALNDLKQAAAHAKQAMVDPPNLAAAIQAGQDADACEAALKEVAPKVVVATDCLDKVARAVRRTIALHARIASGRPFGRAPSPTPPGHPAHPPRPARPASDAERPEPLEPLDRPELGQELDQELDQALDGTLDGEPGAAANEPAAGAVHRDLSKATAKTIRLAEENRPADPPPSPSNPPRPATPAGHPNGRTGPAPETPPEAPPETPPETSPETPPETPPEAPPETPPGTSRAPDT